MIFEDDIPTLHEVVDLAEEYNTAMEDNDREAARRCFRQMHDSLLELRTYLLAMDLVRSYYGQMEGDT